MAIYSVKEFSELVGKEPKDIHVYAGRGKVVKNIDKKIDTTDPINLAFFEEHRINGTVPHTITKPNGRKASKHKGSSQKKEVHEPSEHQKALQRKVQLEVQVKEMDIQAKELDLQKKRGEVVNLQDTINVISAHNHGFMKELDQNIQSYIQDICSRHGIDSDYAGKHKLKVSDIINKSNKKAIEQLNNKFTS